ncbi:protein WHAT'S THIS FACTOR 1 homolog, chloroplastic-like [Magnolia sinica]|uniref:protein WHAT'S THIS FACTOR 1 homolog, chloroplastic-like n=1 Tax=Magnolia sinica TaxID=86752 RepID=UPI002658D988|nr:protein WHAT'S THIS FACTOR 1 homolog, chloroplastic-like [Magnolia sinica]
MTITQLVRHKLNRISIDFAEFSYVRPSLSPVDNRTASGWIFSDLQKRLMTTSKRVQDRSKKKRIHDLEIVTEKWKIASKVLFVIELLKKEPEQIMRLRELERYRQQINLQKPHKVSDFIRKSPKLFELYKDQKGVIWCGLTQQGEDLVAEEERLKEEHSPQLAQYVTRFLMMSVDKRLQVDKIAHFRRDLGLPYDFRNQWIHMFPELFKAVKIDDVEYLELVSWNPAWAVTELEKKLAAGPESDRPPPGLLCLPFPLKFPANYKKIFRYGGQIEHFQKRPYLSPYADPCDLSPGSREFDKRAVAVMHELLSFTLEKRLVTDHLTHFRQEFKMPQKLMRLLLKHFGIFYVSERGKRLSVYLTEAYEGSELIEKCPLVLWKEKIQNLVGYRGRKKRLEMFNEFSDMEDEKLFEDEPNGENAFGEFNNEANVGQLDGALLTDDEEMAVAEEVYNAYKDSS